MITAPGLRVLESAVLGYAWTTNGYGTHFFILYLSSGVEVKYDCDKQSGEALRMTLEEAVHD